MFCFFPPKMVLMLIKPQTSSYQTSNFLLSLMESHLDLSSSEEDPTLKYVPISLWGSYAHGVALLLSTELIRSVWKRNKSLLICSSILVHSYSHSFSLYIYITRNPTCSRLSYTVGCSFLPFLPHPAIFPILLVIEGKFDSEVSQIYQSVQCKFFCNSSQPCCP